MKYVLLIIGFLSLQACGFEIVDTGHRGVETRFGEVDMKLGSLVEGLYFYNPITSNIDELDVRTKKWDDKANTYTKDVQIAEVSFTLNYNLDPSSVHIIYKEVGKDWADKLIPQVVNGRLKAVIGKWEAAVLVNKRNEAQQEAFVSIRDDLKAKHINVTNFEITNIDYSDVFEKSVEDKVVAIQRAVEEQNRTVQIREQATQKIVSAKAEAESMRIRANALTANKNLVEYEAVQKWDGKLPNYMLGGATPFIKLDK